MTNDDASTFRPTAKEADLGARLYATPTAPARGATPTATHPGSTIGSRMYGTPSTPPSAGAPGNLQPAGAIARQGAGPSLAERMYGGKPPTDSKPHASPTHEAPARARETPATDTGRNRIALDRFTSDELALLDREQPIEDRMAETGAVRPDVSAGYQAALAPGFEGLEQEARDAHNADDIAALAEGRKVAAELMHALAVPAGQAREVVSALSAWHGRELTDEQVEDMGDRTVAELRAEWGKDYEAKLRMAQRAAAEATRKAPWLAELWRTGAGNDPALVRHFAGIGLRAARRARRAK